MASSGQLSSPLLLAAQALAGSGPALPANSRYRGVGTRSHEQADGSSVTYFARRLVPPPERQGVIGYYTVKAVDRLDLIASQQLGDPELAWRLCDANRAIDPAGLEVAGRRLRLTLPDGIPVATDA